MRLQLPRRRAPSPWGRTLEAALGIACCLLGMAALVGANAYAGATAPNPTLADAAPAHPILANTAGAPSVDTVAPASASDRPATHLAYQLQVTLDSELHTLQGTGSIRYTNATALGTNELYLHLYLNAFKNSQTLFQRSPFRGARSGDKSLTPGYVEVQKLIAKEWDQLDLWHNAERHSPGDPLDETDIRVPLPRTLAPGETLTLEVQWHAQLPQLSERTGYADDFHMVAQWFPKLARREADGTWAHFAFHPHAEFYADFADYDVTLDVADHLIIGATGERISEQRSGDRQQLQYRASHVHDFAWTAWAGFLEHQETIADVAVRVLYPAAAAPLLERELTTLRSALPHFNQAYGRYPYPTLTVVHPPANAAAAGGMEYPTLITTGGTVLTNLVSRGVELVTIHELGHQWFYGLLASNEAAAPFLDEGLNSYAEAVVANQLWGNASGGRFWDLEVSADALRRVQAASAQHDTAVASAAADFANFSSLGSLVYSRTATILQTLQHVYGAAAMARALAQYSERFRFGHPTTSDFLTTMRETLGEQAHAALHSLLMERGWLDYRVAEVDCGLASQRHGVFGTGPDRVTEPASTSTGSEWVGEVLVRREGTVSLPVDVLLIAEDGSRSIHHWHGAEPWVRIAYRGKSPLLTAVVDPDLT
ncbi:MAG TPA: M1 family metallopeptidase, partial [Polyangiaceae bacterium]|nr:M1 family metallopeptidase [Polyangiaceae bacterium]